MSQAYAKDEVLKIISSVIEKVGRNEDPLRSEIYQELGALHAIIEETLHGAGVPGAADITDKHIPTATDELDAVVSATAEATGTIMDSCEALDEIAAQMGGEYADKISENVTKIYEACSFQDITGQRISKVVAALKSIEEKVSGLMNVLGDGAGTASEDSAGSGRDDDGLLNGPQLPGGGISQDDIDKLLESFD